MRYFYDTEFIEDGLTIELISIGIVAEDGREFYAVSTEFDEKRANSWVRANVISQLPSPSDPVWMSRERMREAIVEFFGSDKKIELWAWSGAYDHVVFAQLFGAMPQFPKQFPHYTHELRQYWQFVGRPVLPELPAGRHDALVDARHNLAKFEECMKVMPLNNKSAVVLPQD